MLGKSSPLFSVVLLSVAAGHAPLARTLFPNYTKMAQFCSCNGESIPLQFRRILVSVISPPAILGLEMAAPILWTPGIFGFFLLENPHAHKIPPFRGGGVGVSWNGGWKCQFYFYGRRDFSDVHPLNKAGGGRKNSIKQGLLDSPPP